MYDNSHVFSSLQILGIISPFNLSCFGKIVVGGSLIVDFFFPRGKRFFFFFQIYYLFTVPAPQVLIIVVLIMWFDFKSLDFRLPGLHSPFPTPHYFFPCSTPKSSIKPKHADMTSSVHCV